MLSRLIFRILAPHYRHPSGFLGKIVGRKMDSLNDAQNDWVISLVDLKPEDTILEIGYGSGKTVGKIAEKLTSGKVYGIDLSETMYQVAAARLQKDISEGKVHLQIGSVEQLPFPDGMFTKVIAVHVVYFWSDLFQVFSELFRVTTKKGVIFISFVSPIIAPSTIFHEHSEKEIHDAIVTAGFTAFQVKKKKIGVQNAITIIAEKK